MQSPQFGPICYKCIGDEFLSRTVEQRGVFIVCAYCDHVRKAILFDNLADRVDSVIQEHFRLTPGYPVDSYESFLYSQGKWDRRGCPVDSIITDIVGVDQRVADDLTSLLAGRYAYPAAKEGFENPYGYDAMYEEQAPFDLEFRLAWNIFRREIRSRSRFMDTGSEELLDQIFGDLVPLKSSADSPCHQENDA